MSNTSIQELIQNTLLDKVETKLLLRHVLNLSAVSLITNHNRQLSTEELARFENLVLKVQNGVPIHYILGVKEFYSREFMVTRDTLIPRPETELLVDEVLKCATPGAKVLDLGTGTGCIAITCKLENPSLAITAVDKYENTLAQAIKNANNLGAEINFICSDWYQNISGQFDLIVSNPPYIEKNDEHLQNLRHEPQHALTDFANGLSCYEKIIHGALVHLNPGGYLLLEHGYLQRKSLRNMLKQNLFRQIKSIQDYAKCDRIISARL